MRTAILIPGSDPQGSQDLMASGALVAHWCLRAWAKVPGLALITARQDQAVGADLGAAVLLRACGAIPAGSGTPRT